MEKMIPVAIARYLFVGCILLFWSAHGHALTEITQLTASPSFLNPGDSVTISFRVQSSASSVNSGVASGSLTRNGEPVFQQRSEFSGNFVGDVVTGSDEIPAEVISTPGTYVFELSISGDDSDGPFSDSESTTFQVAEQQSPQPGDGESTPDIAASMQSIATTEPQRATAAAISTVCPAGVAEPRLQADCNVLVGASFQNKSQASVALGQVTADQASAPVDASQIGVRSQIRNVGTRIAALRSAVQVPTFTFNLNGRSLWAGQMAEELTDGLAGATGGAAGDNSLSFGRWGVYVNGSVTSGDKDRTENVDGFNFDEWSVTLGADYRFRDNFAAGAAVGYVDNDTDLDLNGGELGAESVNLIFYGTYNHESGLYLDGILTYGWGDYDQLRNIRYDIESVSVNQSAKSDFDGTQWSASLGGGYPFSHGALTFGPTARLEYVKSDVDGFQERMSNPNADGGGWATRIEDQDVASFTSQLGVDLSYAVSTNWGVLLPNAHFEWVHEFEDGAENVVGHFVQDPTRTEFSLATDELDENYFNLRLGLSAQLKHGRSAFIYYRKLFGYENLDTYTIGAGVRFEL